MTFFISQWKFVVMGVLLAFIGVQQVRIDHAQNQLHALQTSIAQERAKAAEHAREEEERMEQRKEEILNEADQRVELAKAAEADAAAAADGLRKRLAAFVASAKAPKPSLTGKSEQGADPLDVLAGLLSRLDSTSGELAAYADELRIAGLACESQYESLQPGLTVSH